MPPREATTAPATTAPATTAPATPEAESALSHALTHAGADPTEESRPLRLGSEAERPAGTALQAPISEAPSDGLAGDGHEAEDGPGYAQEDMPRAASASGDFETTKEREKTEDIRPPTNPEAPMERVPEVDARAESAPAVRETTTPLRPSVRTFAASAWSDLLIQQFDQRASDGPGWATIDLDLGEGEGRLSVSARQDEGRLVVAVQLTDPSVRVAAQQHADQIRARLEQHYGTAVDLSFSQGDGDRHAAHQGSREATGFRPHTSPARPSTDPVPPPRASSARQEWIG